jgi:hypothetical protein
MARVVRKRHTHQFPERLVDDNIILAASSTSNQLHFPPTALSFFDPNMRLWYIESVYQPHVV